MRIRYRSTTSDPGQASLEFALVLPLVVVIIAATVWIGAVMRMQMALDHLAYRAARTAATATSRDELHMLVADTLVGASHDALQHQVQIGDELVPGFFEGADAGFQMGLWLLTGAEAQTVAPALGSFGSSSFFALALIRSSRLMPSHMAMAAATNTDE